MDEVRLLSVDRDRVGDALGEDNGDATRLRRRGEEIGRGMYMPSPNMADGEIGGEVGRGTRMLEFDALCSMQMFGFWLGRAN